MGGVPENGKSVICDCAYETITPRESCDVRGLARTSSASWLDPSPSDGGWSLEDGVSSHTRASVVRCETAVTESTAPSQNVGVVSFAATKENASAVST